MTTKPYLPYIMLAMATFLFALLLFHIIPVVYSATQIAWPETKDLMPVGLVVANEFKFALFLIPFSCLILGGFSLRVKYLSSPSVITLVACIAFIIIIVCVLMLCTPIILHGGKLS